MEGDERLRVGPGRVRIARGLLGIVAKRQIRTSSLLTAITLPGVGLRGWKFGLLGVTRFSSSIVPSSLRTVPTTSEQDGCGADSKTVLGMRTTPFTATVRLRCGWRTVGIAVILSTARAAAGGGGLGLTFFRGAPIFFLNAHRLE